ncbi:hypothetical protein DFP72DRAFT_842721 [Ephemerocybe angulata]|uniref:Uncharacterized protein n=1 Tax=Ephemerocybe angulata TaxID=980116 RepID=A0A8H6IB54_9AGAR|nr:hypothetical protein DFP72DRAFT_842721 [Tulosesus angulatus]
MVRPSHWLEPVSLPLRSRAGIPLYQRYWRTATPMTQMTADYDLVVKTRGADATSVEDGACRPVLNCDKLQQAKKRDLPTGCSSEFSNPPYDSPRHLAWSNNAPTFDTRQTHTGDGRKTGLGQDLETTIVR